MENQSSRVEINTTNNCLSSIKHFFYDFVQISPSEYVVGLQYRIYQTMYGEQLINEGVEKLGDFVPRGFRACIFKFQLIR